MKWANFLHIYQPAGQQSDILEEVIAQSYRPLLLGIKAHSHAKVTFNISGALFELLDNHGYHDIIDLIRELVKEGRLELTGSAKYHAFLPFLDESEIKRQIEENTKTLQRYLGEDFAPKGFFPPEMAYSKKVGMVVAELGFEWIILDEISYNGKIEQLKYDGVYKVKGTELKAILRERRPSNLVMSAMVRSADSLIDALGNDVREDRYLLTAMDGETFGHHRPGLEKLLFEIFDSSHFKLQTISEVVHDSKVVEERDFIEATWASSEADIAHHTQFLSWSDPENEIHAWQKKMVDLTLQKIHSMDKSDPRFPKLRIQMDEALASDQFWWASAKPWWSIEEIERGAYLNLSLIREVPEVSESDLSLASKLYEKIVSTAFEWKRSGKIDHMMHEQKNHVRIPFIERTLERGGEERCVYEAFMDMFKDLEKKAVEAKEYEKAILWRDAMYKIEQKTDVYDAIHAIELLRAELPNYQIEKTIEVYKEKYREIRGGQPEQRGA